MGGTNAHSHEKRVQLTIPMLRELRMQLLTQSLTRELVLAERRHDNGDVTMLLGQADGPDDRAWNVLGYRKTRTDEIEHDLTQPMHEPWAA